MDAVSLKLLYDGIQQIGFPIVVALFFMIRHDRKTDKIIDILEKMTIQIQYERKSSED